MRATDFATARRRRHGERIHHGDTEFTEARGAWEGDGNRTDARFRARRGPPCHLRVHVVDAVGARSPRDSAVSDLAVDVVRIATAWWGGAASHRTGTEMP